MERREEQPRRHVEGHIVEEIENKSMRIMWLIAGVLLIGAGIFIYRVTSEVKRKEQAYLAQQEAVAKFHKELEALKNSETEADARSLIARTENKAEFKYWKNTDNEGEINVWIAKSKNLLETNANRRELQAKIDSITSDLRDAASKTSDDLAALRRRIVEVNEREGLLDTEAKARMGTARVTVDRAYAAALHGEAQAAAGSNPTRAALAKYTKAEEEVLKLFEHAITSKNKDEEAFYMQHYKDIISESDVLCAALFTPDVIEKTPAVDLLAGEAAANWAAAELSGFSHRIEGGVMHVVGPDAAAKGNAVISNLDREKEQVRDFVLDMQLTLESGETELYFRVGKAFNNNKVETFMISTKSDQGFVAGKTYNLLVRLIGSTLTIETEPSDVGQYVSELRWTKSRKGGIGFVVPDGTNMKLTRFKVKTLR